MSKEGIKLAGEVFSFMQSKRGELLALGCKEDTVGTKSGHQDILLGQMLDDGKDSIKGRFVKLAGMKIEESKKK